MNRMARYGAGMLLVISALGVGLSRAATNDLDEESTNQPPDSPASVTAAPPVVVELPATTSAVPPVVVEPPPPEPEVEAKPVRRGAELSQAFKGSRGSKFGLSAKQRSLKIPDKAARPKRDKTAWRRTLEVGADSTGGNKDTLRYDVALTAQKETERHFFWLKAGGRYGKSDGEKDTENSEVEARIERSLNERTYAVLDGHIFQDRIADLTYRARANVSLGRYLIRTERTLLGAELGPGYVREKKGGTIDGFAAGRAAQYAERVLLSNLLAWQSVEFILNLEDTTVFFLTTEAGLEVILSPNMSLRFSLQDRYDSAPAEGKKQNDLVTTTSVRWTF
ncbi:MAG: DUF481 domain-containing protein [Verrucomicrobia bacterium]|nr:DUF481 domain-containing protein [Verrucomicrobiota bacterium]MBU1910413.1 DUF481 domain-containing protein [Verrucomicrobiota bacterium]